MKKIGYIYSRILKKMRGVASSNSVIHKTSKVESGSTVIDSTFDKHSFCGYDCNINNTAIGSFCCIASNVNIGGASHPMEYLSMSPVFLSHRDSVKSKFARHHYKCIPKTVIGHDVWIGQGVYIKSGVNVGNGAVIGMGSVLTKDVGVYEIWAGNPAIKIGQRFNNDIINAMQVFAWWDLDDAQLTEVGPFMTNPESLLKKKGLL